MKQQSLILEEFKNVAMLMQNATSQHRRQQTQQQQLCSVAARNSDGRQTSLIGIGSGLWPTGSVSGKRENLPGCMFAEPAIVAQN